MKPRIISNITSLKERPNAFEFHVVLVSPLGVTEEYVFFACSLAQCVTQCTALINYMFLHKFTSAVYIFPTESTTTYRNVYRRVNGSRGDYRMLLCKPDTPLTLEDVRAYYIGY